MVFSNNGLFQCPPLQGRWPAGPEGFPIHVSFRKGNKRVVTTLRMANKTAIMAAAWRTEGVLRPRAEFIKSQFKFSNKVICQVSFKFVSGLFPRFYASDSPLSSL